jgi:hypothetical protein
VLNVGQGFAQRGAASFALTTTPTRKRRVKEGRYSRVKHSPEHARTGVLVDECEHGREGKGWTQDTNTLHNTNACSDEAHDISGHRLNPSIPYRIKTWHHCSFGRP